MGTHSCLNLRKTFASGTASRDVDQQWAHQIANRLPAARPATGYRHGNRYWIDRLPSAQQVFMQRGAHGDKNRVVRGSAVPMCCCSQRSAIHPDDCHLALRTRLLHE
jgi:hypothetical protein